MIAKQDKKQEVEEEWDYVKIIGVIQLCLGMLLIITSVISISYIPRRVLDLHQDVQERLSDMMEADGIDMDELEGIDRHELLLPQTMTALLGIEHAVLFGLLEAILIGLSIILMTQGIVNIKNN